MAAGTARCVSDVTAVVEQFSGAVDGMGWSQWKWKFLNVMNERIDPDLGVTPAWADTLTTEQMIEGYFLATIKAVGTLFREDLYGHTLVIIYSTIDTCGLLDSPPSQTSATGDSFKAWVKRYMLIQPDIEFNDVDMWGARCSILHTFTSESGHSKSGKARELQYYSGDKAAPHVQQFVSFTKTHDGGKHLPIHFGDLCEAFFQAIKAFVPDLNANCQSSKPYQQRLRKIMQVHPYGPAS